MSDQVNEDLPISSINTITLNKNNPSSLILGPYTSEKMENHDKPELQLLPGMTLHAIPRLERLTFIRRLAEMEESGWKPNLSEAKALICKYVLDSYKVANPIPEKNKNSLMSGEQLPWPQEIHVGEESISDGIGYIDKKDYVVCKTKGLGEIIDNPYGFTRHVNGMEKPLEALFLKMDQQDKVELAQYILKNINVFTDYFFGESWEFEKLLDFGFEGLNQATPQTLELGNQMIGYIQEKLLKKADAGMKNIVRSTGENDSLYWLEELVHHNRSKLIYRALANGNYSETKNNQLIGLCIRKEGISSQLNILREMSTDTDLADEERVKYSSMLRRVLNIATNLPVHASLEEVYKALEFEKYKVSERTKEPRTAFLKELFAQRKILKNAKIIDLASGTGWLTGALHEEGYQSAAGIDFSNRNLQVAQKTYGPYFIKGDWNKLPLESGKTDVLLCLGRSLPHTENEDAFNHVLNEMTRVIKEDGTFVFDMPDPTKGSYKENIEDYRNALKQFGFSDHELKNSWVTIDSADGTNFYNRFVPPKEWILGRLGLLGYDVEVREEPIPNEKGDVNLVYVCRKLTASEFSKRKKKWEEENHNYPID